MLSGGRERLRYSDLCEMSDGDLHSLFKSIKSSISDYRKGRKCTKELEVECCYVQKELDDRMRWSGASLGIKRPGKRPSSKS